MSSQQDAALSAVIRFERVGKTFSSRHGDTVALQDLSFSVERGEYVCIVGRSGGGKSTTVNLTIGLSAPTSGTVEVFGHNPYREFDKLRGRMACVFQSDRLLPWRTAVDNVRLPLDIIGLDEERIPVTAAAWLERLGLGGFEKAYPHELSGGMRQRVSLARALVCNPDLIMADESFASLDAITAEELRKDFYALVKATGKTVVHVTHSIAEAIALADRIIVVGKPGRVLGTLRGAAGQPFSRRNTEQLNAEILALMSDSVASAPRVSTGETPLLRHNLPSRQFA